VGRGRGRLSRLVLDVTSAVLSAALHAAFAIGFLGSLFGEIGERNGVIMSRTKELEKKKQFIACQIIMDLVAFVVLPSVFSEPRLELYY
jgi:hypothetical protein